MKGYYTDKNGKVLGYWDFKEKPEDTDEIKWVESEEKPPIYLDEDKISSNNNREILNNLREIDIKYGARCIREYLISIGVFGYNGIIKDKEEEAINLRNKIIN